eukprot:GHVU01011232.1.p1 GENE.GHVU01011232.1~~GHVU01011232.1.p1  ORF type:complete len:463 (-),score=51.87 GHVU01011232.1:340-1728(-)
MYCFEYTADRFDFFKGGADAVSRICEWFTAKSIDNKPQIILVEMTKDAAKDLSNGAKEMLKDDIARVLVAPFAQSEPSEEFIQSLASEVATAINWYNNNHYKVEITEEVNTHPIELKWEDQNIEALYVSISDGLHTSTWISHYQCFVEEISHLIDDESSELKSVTVPKSEAQYIDADDLSRTTRFSTDSDDGLIYHKKLKLLVYLAQAEEMDKLTNVGRNKESTIVFPGTDMFTSHMLGNIRKALRKAFDQDIQKDPGMYCFEYTTDFKALFHDRAPKAVSRICEWFTEESIDNKPQIILVEMTKSAAKDLSNGAKEMLKGGIAGARVLVAPFPRLAQSTTLTEEFASEVATAINSYNNDYYKVGITPVSHGKIIYSIEHKEEDQNIEALYVSTSDELSKALWIMKHYKVFVEKISDSVDESLRLKSVTTPKSEVQYINTDDLSRTTRFSTDSDDGLIYRRE